MPKVFVYGTLKMGGHNNYLMHDATFVSKAVTLYPHYRMTTNGSYPMVSPANDGRHVFGEVWEVDDETLERLDALEGHPHFFCRETVGVAIETGKTDAWMYMVPPGNTYPEAQRNNQGYDWRAA